MDNETRNENEDEQLGNVHGADNASGREDLHSDDIDADSKDSLLPATDDGSLADEGEDIDETDKYLAIEQPGVSYTQDANPTLNSDHSDFGSESQRQEWNEEGGNSRNSVAFNQDDYLLDDNVDLDEDQNQSISSDDEDFEESNERYTN